MTAESARLLDIWRLRIECLPLESVLVLALTGRIGGASADALRDALEDTPARAYARIVADLSGVDYISSAGVVVLVDAGRRLNASHGCLVLCGMGDAVRIAFDLAALASPLHVERDRASAVRTASAPAT